MKYYVTAVPGHLQETIGVNDATTWVESHDVTLQRRYEIIGVAATRHEAEGLAQEILAQA